MKLLVTGGAGYIGSHTIKHLKKNGFSDIVVLDNLENGHAKVCEMLGVEVIKSDLRDFQSLKSLNSKYQFEACLHFAAYASVGESVKDPLKYFLNNYVGSLNLLNYLISKNCKYFVLSSTSEVYGEAEYLPIDENHPLNPTNPYGVSKKMVEDILKWFDSAYGLKFAALRYFNAAGCDVDGEIGELHNPENHLIPNAILAALGKKEFKLTCAKVDTPDNTPIRDYVHVDDLADAHVRALKYLANGGVSDFFNLGTGKGYSVLEVVNAVEKISSKILPKEYGEARAGEPAQKFASNQKARKILMWNPKYNLEDMVKTTYDFLGRN